MNYRTGEVHMCGQIISVCNSERIIKSGQYLPQLCSNEKGPVFFDSQRRKQWWDRQTKISLHRKKNFHAVKRLSWFKVYNLCTELTGPSEAPCRLITVRRIMCISAGLCHIIFILSYFLSYLTFETLTVRFLMHHKLALICEIVVYGVNQKWDYAKWCLICVSRQRSEEKREHGSSTL